MRRPLVVLLLLMALPATAKSHYRRTLGDTLFRSPAGGGVSVTDYTQSILLSLPTLCAGTDLTTDQGGAVTITRASIVYCQTATTITTVAANKPVIEADGLRIEQASSNLLTSDDIFNDWTGTNADVQATQVTDPLGTSTAWQLNTTSSGGYMASPAVTIASTSATFSTFATHETAGTQAFAVEIYDLTSSASKCTGTGTAAASGVWPKMKNRAFCTATITSGHSFEMRIYPGGAAGTADNTGVWGPVLESGIASPSSYMLPGASRAANVASATITNNATAGCIGATMTPMAPAFPQHIFSKASDLAAFNGTASIFTNDGTTTTNSPNVTNMTLRTVPMRVQWGSSAKRVDLDSSTGTPGSFTSPHGSGTTLNIGNNAGVSQFFNGWLKNIKVSTDPAGCAP